MSAEHAQPGAALRATAAEVSLRVVRDRVPLEAALAHAPAADARDAAALRALVAGALRWHHRLEWQLARLLTRPLAGRDAVLGALLRVGLFQIQWLRVPDHAAVSATVEAAERLGLGRAKGLVNAVLRRFLRERPELEAAIATSREARYSHPGWLLDRLERDWPDAWPEIVAASNVPAPMWLRVNALRTSVGAYAERLAAEGIGVTTSTRAPSALLLDEARPTSTLPGYHDGLVSVQDAAAQLAVGLLAPAAGMRVLDACAAPGGKTAHLLESCPALTELVAIDRDAKRLATLNANLARLGLTATVCVADAAEPGEWWDGRPFDRILLDAPCSAIGVIRRHPDIKVLRGARDIDHAVAVQRRLLATLWPLLRSGGRMVYATCTVLREENQEQIARFLAATPDAALADTPSGGELQVLPGEANMDGFYYACLDRQDPVRPLCASHPSQ